MKLFHYTHVNNEICRFRILVNMIFKNITKKNFLII